MVYSLQKIQEKCIEQNMLLYLISVNFIKLKVANVPLSATTITRIDKIADDVDAQFLEGINESSWWAIKVDDSTNFDNKAILLIFVWYIFQEDLSRELQNYLSPWMITYQEDLIGHFVSVYAQAEQLQWLDSFQVWHIWKQPPWSVLSLHTVSSIRKCWWSENYHLRLTVFCKMWLKLLTTSKYMPLIRICLISSEEMDE